jgi:hypothetical protein
VISVQNDSGWPSRSGIQERASGHLHKGNTSKLKIEVRRHDHITVTRAHKFGTLVITSTVVRTQGGDLCPVGAGWHFSPGMHAASIFCAASAAAFSGDPFFFSATS